jgi:O-methyltransferase
MNPGTFVVTGMKRFLPNWIKAPLRWYSDSIRREGGFHERRGRRDVINKAMITLDFNGISGDYAEFGCCGASTFGYASGALARSKRTPRKLWAFDSFAGLPPAEIAEDGHPRWIAGTMKTGLAEFHALCARKGVKNYVVVPGFYRETLREKPLSFFPAGSIAFAYIDCDIYSSTLDVLRFLLPRLKHGMILAFDDYWCYSDRDLSGERRAFLEVFSSVGPWHFEPYQAFGWSGQSFVVENPSR